MHFAPEDNHASTSSVTFLRAGCPSWHPTNSVKALKAFKALVVQLMVIFYGIWWQIILDLSAVKVVDRAIVCDTSHWGNGCRPWQASISYFEHSSRSAKCRTTVLKKSSSFKRVGHTRAIHCWRSFHTIRTELLCRLSTRCWLLCRELDSGAEFFGDDLASSKCFNLLFYKLNSIALLTLGLTIA